MLLIGCWFESVQLEVNSSLGDVDSFYMQRQFSARENKDKVQILFFFFFFKQNVFH